MSAPQASKRRREQERIEARAEFRDLNGLFEALRVMEGRRVLERRRASRQSGDA